MVSRHVKKGQNENEYILQTADVESANKYSKGTYVIYCEELFLGLLGWFPRGTHGE